MRDLGGDPHCPLSRHYPSSFTCVHCHYASAGVCKLVFRVAVHRDRIVMREVMRVAQKIQHGPVVVAAVRRNGFGSFSHAMIVQLVCLMAGALLLTWLLLQTSGLSYTRRVAFLAIAGLAASVIVDLPNWN